MSKFVTIVFAALTLCGCMTEREYQLRKRQLIAQEKHPSTYELFTIDGPVKLEVLDGGKARVNVPNQPFKEIPIPDGAKTQADLIKHIVNVGGLSVLGWKAIDNANGDKTTINNTAAEGGEVAQ
jgi:hypothetical protein